MAKSGALQAPLELASDQQAVTARVQASGTSFFWAMRFLPKAKRDAMFAVYAFCRDVDDIADGDLSADAKRLALEQWRLEIARLYQGNPTREVTRALLGPVLRFSLDKSAFLAVIDGMQMDAEGPIRAPSAEMLELYCARVAGAVGLLCINIFGLKGADGEALAEHLGRALQLTNILRDLHEDCELGRLYLPQPLLVAHQIATTDPAHVLRHPALRDVARDLGRQARASFDEARAIIARSDPNTVRPARIMMEVYARALGRLEQEDFAFVAEPHPQTGFARTWSKAQKLAIALRYALI